jgi:hypothetical protein
MGPLGFVRAIGCRPCTERAATAYRVVALRHSWFGGRAHYREAQRGLTERNSKVAHLGQGFEDGPGYPAALAGISVYG